MRLHRLRLPKRWSATVAAIILTTMVVLLGSASPALAATAVSVPATQPWTDTGMDVSGSVTLQPTGTIDVGGPEGSLGPGGSQTGCVAGPSSFSGQWVLNGVPCWSLIGRVGNGQPFGVGGGGTFHLPSGRLYLGVDDEVAAFGDNSGSWTVQVGTNGLISGVQQQVEEIVIPPCRTTSSLYTECQQARQALVDYVREHLGVGLVCVSLEQIDAGAVCEYIESVLGIPGQQRLNELLSRLEQLARN
jgi:hypothetical protein